MGIPVDADAGCDGPGLLVGGDDRVAVRFDAR